MSNLLKVKKQSIAITLFVNMFIISCAVMAKDSTMKNIVANPGFEEGGKKWGIKSMGEISDKEVHQGKFSALIKCNSKGKLKHISQTLSLPPAGSMIYCSFWVKTSDPKVQYQVYFDITATIEGGNPKWFMGPGSGVKKNSDGKWRKVKFHFKFPENAVGKDSRVRKMSGLYFRLATPGKISGNIWFDDISVIIIPPDDTSVSQSVKKQNK